MPEDVADQSGVVTIDADDPALGSVADAAPAATPPVPDAPTPPAPDDAPPAPDAPPPTFDLATPDGIKAAVEASPALRNHLERERLAAENTGRQKRETELRRDQGSIERAGQIQAQLLAKYGVELDAEDTKAMPLFVSANETYVRAELSRQLLQQASGYLGEAEGAALLAIAEGLEGKPEELTNVAQQALNAAVTKARADSVAGLTLGTVPATAPLFAEINARVEAAVIAELAARDLSDKQADRTNAPQVPVGAPGTGASGPQTADDWMQAYARGQVDHVEYKNAMTTLGVKLRA